MYGGCLRESHRVVCVFFNPMENEVTLEEFIFHTLESGIDVGHRKLDKNKYFITEELNPK